jgi:hypothetical protein
MKRSWREHAAGEPITLKLAETRLVEPPLQSSAEPPLARMQHSILHYRRSIFIVFGRLLNEPVNPTEILALDLNAPSLQWEECLDLQVAAPPPRSGHSCCSVNNTHYFFGGFSLAQEACLQDLSTLEFGTVHEREWTQRSAGGDPPSARRGHSCNYVAVAGGCLVIFGGSYSVSGRGHLEGDKSLEFNDTVCYGISSNEWWRPETQGVLPDARRCHGAVAVGDKIIVFGGIGMQGLPCLSMHVLDSNNWTWSALNLSPSTVNSYLQRPKYCSNAMLVDGAIWHFEGGCLIDIVGGRFAEDRTAIERQKSCWGAGPVIPVPPDFLEEEELNRVPAHQTIAMNSRSREQPSEFHQIVLPRERFADNCEIYVEDDEFGTRFLTEIAGTMALRSAQSALQDGPAILCAKFENSSTMLKFWKCSARTVVTSWIHFKVGSISKCGSCGILEACDVRDMFWPHATLLAEVSVCLFSLVTRLELDAAATSDTLVAAAAAAAAASAAGHATAAAHEASGTTAAAVLAVDDCCRQRSAQEGVLWMGRCGSTPSCLFHDKDDFEAKLEMQFEDDPLDFRLYVKKQLLATVRDSNGISLSEAQGRLCTNWPLSALGVDIELLRSASQFPAFVCCVVC